MREKLLRTWGGLLRSLGVSKAVVRQGSQHGKLTRALQGLGPSCSNSYEHALVLGP